MAKSCCTPSRSVEGADGAVAVFGRGEGRRGMVSLPGGPFLMGSDGPETIPADGEGPVRPVLLAPFEIDAFPVTNAEFATFVNATGYVTEAERFGSSFVFQDQVDGRPVLERLETAPWWCLVEGACWSAPAGTGSTGRADHPVVQVSWNDAAAFAAWAECRLPTEAEWEYAARGGLKQTLYPWGNELTPGGEHRANIWQGSFPNHNTAEDGFAATCPVDAFPPNGFGLYSMTGNTWEWCADNWGTVFTAEPAVNPTGPPFGVARVMRGGSFLCHSSYCNRYRVSARTHNTPESAASNIGFRLAR